MVGLSALGLIAGVVVQVHANPCTSSTAVDAALAHLDAPRVGLELTPVDEGFEVRLRAGRAADLVRTLVVAPADCDLVPQMLALMTERFVRALPAHTWAPRAPATAGAWSPQQSLPLTPMLRHPRHTLAWGLDAGASLGSRGQGPAVQLHTHLDLRRSRLGLTLGLGTRWEPSRSVGDSGGSVTWVSAWLGLGGFARLELGPLPLRFEAGVAGGLAHGQGRGFEGASADTVALVEGMARAVAQGPFDLYGGLEARVNLVGPRFADYEVARLRLGLFLGIHHDLAFF